MTGDDQLGNGPPPSGVAPPAPAGAAAARPGSQVDAQRYTNARDGFRFISKHSPRSVCVNKWRAMDVGVLGSLGPWGGCLRGWAAYQLCLHGCVGKRTRTRTLSNSPPTHAHTGISSTCFVIVCMRRCFALGVRVSTTSLIELLVAPLLAAAPVLQQSFVPMAHGQRCHGLPGRGEAGVSGPARDLR